MIIKVEGTLNLIFMDQGDSISGSEFLLADFIFGRIKDNDFRIVEDRTRKVAPEAYTNIIIPEKYYKLVGYILEILGT